ncbi:MAG: hypothetical protein GX638_07615 [Crenarchaeota archaeon]|nr:hypothetical protein [Thermoproteota archaeon]
MNCDNPSGPKELDRGFLMGEWSSDYVSRVYGEYPFTTECYTKCNLVAGEISFKVTLIDSAVRLDIDGLMTDTAIYEFLQWKVFNNEVVCTSYVHPSGGKSPNRWNLEYKTDNSNELWLYQPCYTEKGKFVYSWFKYKKIK